ncbi:MAG TPA: FKBP-type peptidyl-prolyl cis-trans isomerase [Puia sp.]
MHKTTLTFIVLIILTFIVAVSCGKSSSQGSVSCTTIDPTADSSALLSFARTNGMTPVKDTTGLYYQIITQGTGATLNGNSRIFVTYTGTLLNGTIFDSTTNAAKTGFQLGTLIAGWQIGLPKIQAGGHIKLLIPSAYGYGCLGSGTIPPNSPIYFDVTLVSVQ